MYLKISYPRNLFLGELGKLGSKRTDKFSKGTWYQMKKIENRPYEETSYQERCARKAAWDLAKNIHKLKNSNKTRFYVPGEVEAMPAPSSKRPEEREFVVDFGASMHMMSKKDLSSEEIWTVKGPETRQLC